jgi:hypothetical protein
LQDDVQNELRKPIVHGLDGAVGHLMGGTNTTRESSDEMWHDFWKNPPNAVGVDTEGNTLSPPVLVQVATDHFVILEAPNAVSGLSRNLKRLFADDSILKVFCDCRSQRYMTSLGLRVPVCMESDHVVDVEVLAEERIWARVAVPRGLSKLLSLTMPELGVRIAKESGARRLVDIGIYADIEQGRRPPLRGVCENSPRTSNGDAAALDAWVHVAGLETTQRMNIQYMLLCHIARRYGKRSPPQPILIAVHLHYALSTFLRAIRKRFIMSTLLVLVRQICRVFFFFLRDGTIISKRLRFF